MKRLRALLTLAAGGLVTLSLSTVQAATPCVDPCDAVQLSAEDPLGDVEMGRTSCEIERGEEDSDWIIRIKHNRDGKGPKTSRCVIVPERAKDDPKPKPKPHRGEAPGPDRV